MRVRVETRRHVEALGIEDVRTFLAGLRLLQLGAQLLVRPAFAAEIFRHLELELVGEWSTRSARDQPAIVPNLPWFRQRARSPVDDLERAGSMLLGEIPIAVSRTVEPPQVPSARWDVASAFPVLVPLTSLFVVEGYLARAPLPGPRLLLSRVSIGSLEVHTVLSRDLQEARQSLLRLVARILGRLRVLYRSREAEAPMAVVRNIGADLTEALLELSPRGIRRSRDGSASGGLVAGGALLVADALERMAATDILVEPDDEVPDPT